MGGIRFIPTERFDLGIGVSWTTAEAGLDPFSLAAPEYAETHPLTWWNFERTPEYSNLDTEYLDLELDARYHIAEGFWLSSRYRLVDFNDNDPYLYDLSGAVDYFQLGMGWTF